MCVCLCVRARTRACEHMYLCAYVRACVHACVGVSMRVRACVCVCVGVSMVCVCVYAQLYVSVLACVCVCAQARVWRVVRDVYFVLCSVCAHTHRTRYMYRCAACMRA